MPFDISSYEISGNNPLTYRLLASQLSVGLAHCRVARVRLEFDSKYDPADIKASAQRAYDVASHLAQKVGLQHSQIDEMTAQLERLRFELRSFDGRFDTI